MTSVQTIHTDSKGYFQFTLGAGMQGNQDITASDTPMQTMPNGTSSPGDFGGMTGMSGMGGFCGMGSPGSSLVGCELRVSVSGYRPIEKTITDSGDIGQIDAGTLQLQRIEGAQGSSISVTSLQVPEKARKEFEKGDKELHSKHLDAATEHLEKAVADYDKYAVAWTELGQIYTAKQKPEMAQKAFTKAIDSDPKYIPPFVALAALDLQTEKYESAAEFAGKALELDPRIGLASYVEALADFKLNKLDDAEKSALAAEKQPHQNIPQVHVLLANIFLQKEDESKAAAQMRAYLKEAPQGNFAPQVKDSLAQIEESAGKDGADTAQEQIAP